MLEGMLPPLCDLISLINSQQQEANAKVAHTRGSVWFDGELTLFDWWNQTEFKKCEHQWKVHVFSEQNILNCFNVFIPVNVDG